jgi:hypothetical protein
MTTAPRKPVLAWPCRACGHLCDFESFGASEADPNVPAEVCGECREIDRMGTDKALQAFAVDQVGHLLRAWQRNRLPPPLRYPFGRETRAPSPIPDGFDPKPKGWNTTKRTSATSTTTRKSPS